MLKNRILFTFRRTLTNHFFFQNPLAFKPLNPLISFNFSQKHDEKDPPKGKNYS